MKTKTELGINILLVFIAERLGELTTDLLSLSNGYHISKALSRTLGRGGQTGAKRRAGYLP